MMPALFTIGAADELVIKYLTNPDAGLPLSARPSML